MNYSQVIFFCALFSLVYSECSLKGQIFSYTTETHVRAEPESQLPVLRDCKAWRQLGLNQSGIYPVKPDFGKSFQVYCDMETDGGGWTVFQRRMDGSVDFYRYWSDYKQGFGDLSGEFWLGLDKIHRLTATNHYKGHSLRIDIRDLADKYIYAQYSSFSIGDERSKYTLSVSGYNGTTNDCMSYHNGMKFTTKDQDNDNYSDNCAVGLTGAWWYNVCHHSNLNGEYMKIFKRGDKRVGGRYLWSKLDSLKFDEMKSRPN